MPRSATRAAPAAAESDAPKALGPLKLRLARIGLVRDWDFVLHLPLRYEDETRITPIAALVPGVEAQVEAEVLRSEVTARGRRQLSAVVRDESGVLQLRFLHFYASQIKQLEAGRKLRIFGTMRDGYGGAEMVHPRVRSAEGDRPLPGALTPVYPAGEGIAQTWLRKRIARALLDVDVRDLAPAAVRERLGLPELRAAIERLHHPPPGADQAALSERRDAAWQRLKFDELLAQQIALRESRELRGAQVAPVLAAARAPAASLVDRLGAALPFELTAAQERVWAEVAADLARAVPMHRLVQGDVGSGKTVIAALAAARAIENAQQAALMAPTEILAEQHFRKIAQWLEPLGVRIAWLAGRLKPSEKAAAQARVAAGEADLVVGTHALIQDAVSFPRLGLAIVDEQHRFGVAQRLALRSPVAERVPHLLMLSATPIPRTLAMSYLADLDVSVIDQMPPGREPITTKLLSLRRKDEVIASIRAEAAASRQAYWVCPLIEASDELELNAATETFEQIAAALPELRVGLLHGQLPAADKAAVMDAFSRGEIDVLVATTVIEVGVDVPRATLMVIEHAERFGLAQLHQLRGRVGRGGGASWCILLFDEPLSETARERLKVIYETTDGFEVARRDLAIRGPGEFLGARQSGVPMLRFAELEADAHLVEAARDFASEWLSQDPAAAREHARRWFEGRQGFLSA